MMHLTRDSVRQLLEGTMDPIQARALAAHLESDCPECDAVLASGPAGSLDGLADRALAALAPPSPEEAGNDLEYARIRRLRSRPPGRRRWAPLVALAASLVVVGGVAVKLAVDRSARESSWDGMKGVAARPSRAVPVRLSAVAVLPQPGGQPRIWKVTSGESVPHDAALQLQIEVGRAADVAVARAGLAGDVDVFWHERVAAAGPVQLSVAGRPAAYPLAGLAGPQRLVVVASPSPLAAEQVTAAARALAPPGRVGGETPALEGLSIAVVELRVK